VDSFGGPTDTWKHGLIDGGNILVEKKKQSFTFVTLFCFLELLGAAWEIGEHVVFSIAKLNQSKTNRPRAQSSYQRMGEAPWRRMYKSWPEVVVVTHPPETDL
jgi:hypothetical protein